MSFLTPMFLVALAGMAVPVLIHLLTRDRIRRVEFSTLRFFVRTSSRVLRRKRFREMLLLLLRAAVCGLLAAAFARPLLRDDEDGSETVRARTARVILADVSASMARGGSPRALKDAAREALESLSPGTDAAAVLTFAETVKIEAPLAKDFARASQAVESLQTTCEATNIPQALRWADAQLRRARASKREIVLISDLQRTGWQHLKEDFKLAPGVKLTVRGIRVEATGPQVAVGGASFPETTVLDKEPVPLSVQLVNYSADPVKGVEVRFVLGDKPRTRKVNLRGRGTATATFRYVFETPGDNPGHVDVAGAAALYFNTRVIPKIKVVLVDGGRRAGRASNAAFYVETAMAPGMDVASPFECRTRGPGEVTPADLRDAQAAVLVNVPSAAPAVRRALRELLRRGGGLWWMPGDRVKAAAFARDFAEIAPCKLRKVRTGRLQQTGGYGAALGSIDYHHPIFEIFSHPRHGDLSLPKFRQYWEVTDSQLAQVLAKFDDNRPAVLARQVDGGVTMMLATCPDAAWTNFARQTTFLPYVWQTLKYLAARTEEKTTYLVGDSLPVPEKHQLVAPGGKADEAGRFAARQPGFYTLKAPDGRHVTTFAVNRDPAESDPTTVAADEIVQAVERPAEAGRLAAANDDQDDGPATDDLGLWWWVVVSIAVLLAAELLLGNRTLRH